MRKSRSTGFTPKDAQDPKNYVKVKNNLEKHRLSERTYPEIKIGDKVRLFKKRKNFQKQDVSIWSDRIYEVNEIEEVPKTGKLYHLNGVPKPVLRSEILLV